MFPDEELPHKGFIIYLGKTVCHKVACTEDMKNQILNELHFLKLLNEHENIVNFITTYEAYQLTHIVMEKAISDLYARRAARRR